MALACVFIVITLIAAIAFYLPVFFIGTFLAALFGVLFYFKFEEIRIVKAQILKAEISVETSTTDLIKATTQLESARKNSALKQKSIEETITKYKDIIENANQYLTYNCPPKNGDHPVGVDHHFHVIVV